MTDGGRGRPVSRVAFEPAVHERDHFVGALAGDPDDRRGVLGRRVPGGDFRSHVTSSFDSNVVRRTREAAPAQFRHGPASQAGLGDGVLTKETPVADVAPQDSQAAVAGLVHDGAFGGAAECGRGRETGAQAVAGMPAGIVARGQPAFDDAGDRFVGKAPAAGVAVAVDGNEHRAVVAAGGIAPGAEHAHRARGGFAAVGDADLPSLPVRIGLRAPDGDREPFLAELDIRPVEGDQFGAPEGAGEAGEQQRAIAQPDQILAQAGERRSQIVDQQRLFGSRGGALGAPDAGH